MVTLKRGGPTIVPLSFRAQGNEPVAIEPAFLSPRLNEEDAAVESHLLTAVEVVGREFSWAAQQ